MFSAANELRDISTALINKANNIAQTNIDAEIKASTMPSDSHKISAKRYADDAIRQLELAKTIVEKHKSSSSYFLQLAENMINSAQSSYSQFQIQLSLAERYQNFANGMSSDLADTSETTWWRAESADAEGRITSAIYGNGITTQREYNASNGQLLNISSSDGVQTLQNLNYVYDDNNNVKSRTDDVLNYTDSYEYDYLERLVQSQIDATGLSAVSKTWAYDKIGNIDYIDSENDNNYTYDLAGKLTDTTANGDYKYDDNGNQTSGAGRTIKWSSFNKPISFARGLSKTEFTYNADHSRMLKVKKHSNVVKSTTLYFNGYEKTTFLNGDIEHKYHIAVGSSVVAVKSVKKVANSPTDEESVNYLHKDALGSVDLITDDKGDVVERMGYTPFGLRRDLTALEALSSYASLNLPTFSPVITKRGYTGHEHIDEMDLIHMNGRVYDPEVGRFLSADPFVQAPDRTQSFNRYAYVMNNPLKYTDPSGFEWDDNLGGFNDLLGYDPNGGDGSNGYSWDDDSGDYDDLERGIDSPTKGGNPPSDDLERSSISLEPKKEPKKKKLEDVTTNKLYPRYKTNKGTIIKLNGLKTYMPSGKNLDALIKFADATGLKEVLITGGTEIIGHSKGSYHGKNLAIDVAGTSFNNLTNDVVLSTANKAGYTHAVYEDFEGYRSDHWHLQIGAGNGLGDKHLTTNTQMITKYY